MARLLSFEVGQLTSFDLGANAFWRLVPQATQKGRDPALALSMTFPPGFVLSPVNGTPYPTQVHLVRVPIKVADDVAQVARIAEVMLQGGTEESDRERMREAFMLFKNQGRAPSEDRLKESIEAGFLLVNAYWQIRSWIRSGYEGSLELDIQGTEIIGVP